MERVENLAGSTFMSYGVERPIYHKNATRNHYDDYVMFQIGECCPGTIIVSNDKFRDINANIPSLPEHRAEWKDILENRILPYNFFGENFKPVLDPTSSYYTLDSDISGSRKRQRFSKDDFSTSPSLKSYLTF